MYHMRVFLPLTLIILFAVSPPQAVAADYTFTRIDIPFAGALDMVLSGINNRGQIVGWYQDADGVLHGFLIDEGIVRKIDVPFAGVRFKPGTTDQ